MSDILVLYVLKRRTYYRDNKYLNVNDPSKDYEVIEHKDVEEVNKLLMRTQASQMSWQTPKAKNIS